MDEKLKPCPFCGTPDIFIGPDHNGVYTCVCRGCLATTMGSLTKAVAIAIWNRREKSL